MFVTIDTLRADHVGSYGYRRNTTPRFDRLAEDGLLFETAVTTMATTLPAHTSLMTSTYPSRHGVRSNFAFYEVPVSTTREFRTVAQMLQTEGFRTGAFVSTIALARSTGIAAGFDVYDQPKGIERKAEDTMLKALAWLASQPDERFFLWVHLFDPHHTYAAPADYAELFAVDDQLRALIGRRRVDERFAEIAVKITNAYDAEIRYADAQLGKLLDALRDGDWYDSATIVVTSDHGEGLLQHDHPFHGVLYNEELDVPLVIKFPLGVGPPPRRVKRLISLIDVLPTVAAYTELPLATEQFDGRNGLMHRRSYAVAERERTSRRFGDEVNYALRGERWKYVHYSQRQDELYDLAADYGERNNVIETYPDVASDLAERLFAIVADAESRAPAIEVSNEITERQREALKALGYSD